MSDDTGSECSGSGHLRRRPDAGGSGTDVDADHLRIRPVTDAEREAWTLPVYGGCLEWCAEVGVLRPQDLIGRVVGHERFLREWIRRCHALEVHPGDPADVTVPGSASE